MVRGAAPRGRPSSLCYDPGAMTKQLCKLSQSAKKNFEVITSLVDRPRFVCTDCCRAANEKKRLCEPKRIPGTRKGQKGQARTETGSPVEE